MRPTYEERLDKVNLTVGRIAGSRKRLTILQMVELNQVLASHGIVTRDHLVYACLTCSSIAEVQNTQSARDAYVEHFDFICCNPSTTVTFRTERI